jgi:hypothetical protein
MFVLSADRGRKLMATKKVQEQLDEYRAAIEDLAREQELLAGVCVIGDGDTALLRPVLDPKGLRWVCIHEVEHSTVVVAGLRK